METTAIAPQPPYYAVIFSSNRTSADAEGYAAAAERMAELARQQPGFLGMESARDEQGFGITVSYWESEEAIRLWREHVEHRLAQASGREKWYARYALRVARVERAWAYEAEQQVPRTR